MAQVPRYDGPKVAPTTEGTPFQRVSADPMAFGGGLAQGLGAVGDSLGQAGDMLLKHALRIQGEDNSAEADNLTTKYLLAEKDLLYMGDNAYYTKMGKDAYEGYRPAQDSVVALRDSVTDEASNPAVRKLVASATQRQMTFSLSGMASHAGSERKKWVVDSTNAAMDAAIDKSALYYNNDKAFDDARSDIIDQTFKKSQLLGWGPEQFDNAVKDNMSKAWTARIDRTLQDDPFAAREMFNQHKEDLNATALVGLSNKIDALVTPQEIRRSAAQIAHGMPVVAPDDLHSVIVSDGEHGKAGQVSPKGALGSGQVMPETAAAVAASLGIAFDPKNPADVAKLKNDDAFNAMISKAYLSEQVRRFGGDPLKAAAAYNAGPGWVAQAEARAEQFAENGGIGPQADWQWQLANDGRAPKNQKETAGYISRVAGALEAKGQRVSGSSVDVVASLPARIAEAEKLAAAQKPGDEIYADGLVKQVKSDWTVEKQQAQALEFDATDRLLTSITGGANEDGPKTTSVGQLLKDPQAASDWAVLPQAKRMALTSYITRNSKAEQAQKWTPEAVNALQKFKAEAYLSPETFLQHNFTTEEYANWMPLGMMKELNNLQLRTSQMSKKAVNENLSHAMSMVPVKTALTQAGLLDADTGKPSDPDKYNAFAGAMLSEIDTFISVHGRKPNDSDLIKLSNNLFIQQPKTKVLGMEFGGGLEFNSKGQTTNIIQGVPNAEASQISEAYRKRFGRDPTSLEIAQAYRSVNGQ